MTGLSVAAAAITALFAVLDQLAPAHLPVAIPQISSCVLPEPAAASAA
jgi:hypothetical protein